MGTTLPSASVTSTGFSPAATHFLAQASWAAFAPLAAHLSSLIQPAHLPSLAKADTAIKEHKHIATASFFISISWRINPCGCEPGIGKHSSLDTTWDAGRANRGALKIRSFDLKEKCERLLLPFVGHSRSR